MADIIGKDSLVPMTPEKKGLSSLTETLNQNWDKVVVDLGCGNRVSTVCESGTLLILVDRNMGDGKLNWGPNHMESGSKVIKIKKDARDISEYLQAAADRVQIIAPDPDHFWEMFDESQKMVKPNGEIVILLDIASNKQEGVDEIRRQLTIEKFPGFSKDIYKPGEVDIDDLVEGEVNSDFIFHPAYAIVLTKKN